MTTKTKTTTYPDHIKTEDQRLAFDQLAKMLEPGQDVYTNVNHVSRSGMSRDISAYVIHDGELFCIDYLLIRMGMTPGRNGGVRMGGAGMDMTFALVYNLGRTLFFEGYRCNGSTGYTPKGNKSKRPRCRSNDHSNGEPLKAGMWHKDGGYALNRLSL